MKKSVQNNNVQRRLRYGGFSVILTALVIAAVILLNVAFGALEAHWGLALDATAMQVTDFDDRTIEVVKSVSQPVTIYTVYSPSTSTHLRVQIEDILEKIHAMNNNLLIDNLNPATQPDVVQAYAGDMNVTEGSIVVVNEDGSRFRYIPRNDFYYGYTSSYDNQDYSVFALEGKLATALLNVTNENTPKVYFLTGHGEIDPLEKCTVIFSILEESNYEPCTMNYSSDGFLPKKGDCVVMLEPQTDLSDKEYNDLLAWMQDGGRLMVNFSYTADLTRLPNYVKLLDYYSLSYGDGYIVESQSAASNWRDDLFALVPDMDQEHEITSRLLEYNYTTYMPYSRPINAITYPEYGSIFTNLLTSSPAATVVVGEESGTPGTQIVAQSLQVTDYEHEENDTRIIMTGAYGLLYDTYMMYYTHNPHFLSAAFDWLINQKLSVSVTSKYLELSEFTLPNAATAWTLAAIVVIAIPLVVAAAGVVVWLRRRRL